MQQCRRGSGEILRHQDPFDEPAGHDITGTAPQPAQGVTRAADAAYGSFADRMPGCEGVGGHSESRIVPGLGRAEEQQRFCVGGEVAPRLGSPEDAERVFAELERVGVDYDDVTDTLEREGVDKFADSFSALMDALEAKRESLAVA